ncbi:MAG: amidohydrolase family protein [Chitinophagaceae bacterium]
MLRNKDCTLVLGTDSLASNHSLNMLDELRAIQHAFEDEITLCELLQWVTLNGAAALKMENNLGSFDAGKKPGVLLMENLQAYAIVPETCVRRLF